MMPTNPELDGLTLSEPVPGHEAYVVAFDPTGLAVGVVRIDGRPQDRGILRTGRIVDHRRRVIHLSGEKIDLGALVAALDHGPRPKGMVVAHLDGDAANNRRGNCVWQTVATNNLGPRRSYWLQDAGYVRMAVLAHHGLRIPQDTLLRLLPDISKATLSRWCGGKLRTDVTHVSVATIERIRHAATSIPPYREPEWKPYVRGDGPDHTTPTPMAVAA